MREVHLGSNASLVVLFAPARERRRSSVEMRAGAPG
jgi:hypothetical protein